MNTSQLALILLAYLNISTIFAQKQNWGLINKSGKALVPFGKYEAIGSFNENRCAVAQNGKWGFIDSLGKEVIPCQYEQDPNNSSPLFIHGYTWVKKRGKWGLINKNGKVLISFQYQEALDFYRGLALVKKKDKWGFINQEGSIVIPIEYDQAGNPSELGWISLKKGDKWGVVNDQGTEIIPFIYHTIKLYDDIKMAKVGKKVTKTVKTPTGNLAATELNWGIIDQNGKELIPSRYAELDYLAHAKVIVANLDGALNDANNRVTGGSWGMLSLTGETLIPFGQYEKISLEEHPAHWAPLIGVKKSEKFGFVTPDGKEVIPCYYDAAFMVAPNLIAANYGSRKGEADWHRGVIGGKWGFLATNGAELLPFEYDGVSDFYNESLILVNKGCQLGYLEDVHCNVDKGWGLINHKGKEIVPCHYLSITGNYHEGMLAVLRLLKSEDHIFTKKWAYLDQKGKEIIQPTYNDATDFSGNVAQVNLNGRWGIINREGEALSDFKYDEMCCQQENLIGVFHTYKWLFFVLDRHLKRGKRKVG